MSAVAGLWEAHIPHAGPERIGRAQRIVEANGLLRPRPDYYVAKIVVNAALMGIGLFGLRLASLGLWWWLADVAYLSFVFVQIIALAAPPESLLC